MRSRRNVTLVFGARGHLGQSGCEDPVESLESCLYHARLASRRTTQSSIGGDPEGHPCRYDSNRIKLTGISRAARLATGGDAARLATGETRLGYTEARGAASHADAAHTRRGLDAALRFRLRARGRGAAPGSFVGWRHARRIGFEWRLRETAVRGSKRLPSARSERRGWLNFSDRRGAASFGCTDRLDRSDATRLGYPPDRSGAASAVLLRSKRRGEFRLGWRLRIRLQTRGGWFGFHSACRRAADRLRCLLEAGGVRRRRGEWRRLGFSLLLLFFFLLWGDEESHENGIELKVLPSHLKYVFLGEKNTSCHNFKGTYQRTKSKEVVKKEVLKLKDVGIIYPIPHSTWVSSILVVPKKISMAIVENSQDEFVSTCVSNS
ncbi:uncharacterized protein E6C27_scaffold226G00500 [Cucumis melo var. makuwa]|uniref:Uncharacterized protein n=1 Tax=Cucumis melo var. makuwa TaxID=1194695 RepID=A0A5A7UMB9_CUCMM|nr:uncharacterized protein E6C27_scaffold226G00500 [Cucumis melo var. makuwa]